jgi:glycine/D-amino acid oxidase-like deaminating enzyme
VAAPTTGEPFSRSAATDVAIIGGGYTGLNAAIRLAGAGLDVTLLEAEHPGWGASGRNGGFCCLGGSIVPEAALARRFGADAPTQWETLQDQAVTHVDDLIRAQGIEVDRHSDGETVLAHSAKSWARLKKANDASARLIEASDLAEHGLGGDWFGAMTTPTGFALNPRKYHTGLWDLAARSGVRLFSHSPVTGLTNGNSWHLTTPKGVLRADQVVLATNGYSADDLPDWLRARYLPVQSSVIVTRPLTRQEQEDQGWWSDQMAYDTRQLLHYFRKLPDDRFLFGMRGGLTAKAREQKAISTRIRSDFARLFPAWAQIDITHEWSGLVCLMADLLPFVGPVPGHAGLFAAMGYHGNGVAMGSYAGDLLARHMLEKAPLPDMLCAPPGRFPLGRFRRHLLRPAYLMADLFDL